MVINTRAGGPNMGLKDTSAGAAVYFPIFLRYIYDPLVLGLYCPCAWQISSEKLRTFFNTHVTEGAARSRSRRAGHTAATGSDPGSCRMLDIGVGTGYFLKHAPIPAAAEVALVDLNPAALRAASSRTTQAHPKVLCKTSVADFLDPSARGLSPEELGGGGNFDAISVMLLLHCVPGPPARKAEALVRLGRLLAPDGRLFGATILGRGVRHNAMGRVIMYWHNRWGVFGNSDDDVESFVGPLRDAFEDVRWEVSGTMLLFEASKPRV
ncbi:putative uncharacterized protein YbcY [Colletotrichum sidae]|nr:putative uncharacterized protein YbcY [Colletotrichum sidae]